MIILPFVVPNKNKQNSLLILFSSLIIVFLIGQYIDIVQKAIKKPVYSKKNLTLLVEYLFKLSYNKFEIQIFLI